MTQDDKSKEMVNHPDHYKTGNPAYEPYKVIGEWGCNFNIGNAIKYLARYKQKWNPVEDLQKAKKYIDFEIERLLAYGDSDVPVEDRSDGHACPGRVASDSLARHGEDIVDKANRALDNGVSRIEVMKNILGMSDDEISEISKMNDLDKACEKVAGKIAGKFFRTY